MNNSYFFEQETMSGNTINVGAAHQWPLWAIILFSLVFLGLAGCGEIKKIAGAINVKPPETKYGAFAIARDGSVWTSGRGTTGSDAKDIAFARCRSLGGDNCRSFPAFSKCGALAVGPRGAAGFGQGDTIAEAQETAINFCLGTGSPTCVIASDVSGLPASFCPNE